ncbi:sigma-70 family RNA polymerase sigma factor [[Clostridium] innocuum]|nr:sigma factor-like helix-turn-helix DNA-binding protein [[Clostridium] innocuum]MCG4660777.1 sigma-70 family RNA polymerase sigma factor [[Clostridium] innocuum]
MSYNYIKEYLKWKTWKEQEEQILRQEKVSETIIQELRNFDWEQFNSERRFKRNHNITNDSFFLIYPIYDKKEIKSVDDILDNIESEAFYEYLSETDPIMLEVILLKIKGYSIKEISEKMNLPISTIYHKIKKLKKFQNS